MFCFVHQTRELYKDYMNQTVQLLMRDAGLMETLSVEDRNAKLEQFLKDTYTMERQVASVSKLLCCIIGHFKNAVWKEFLRYLIYVHFLGD